MTKRRYLDEVSAREYIVQKGDTLSKIAQNLSGNYKDYLQIANANNIDNPDLIKVGQKLIIPEKFDKPLKFSEIPTNNRLSVIDDYSPNYNYIVEGDKIYYSRKGHNDYWVDISDNQIARNNLFKHIGSKYNYKGYEDNEKSIGDAINSGTYDYKKAISVQNKKPIKQTLAITAPVVTHYEEPNSVFVKRLENQKKPTLKNTKTLIDSISDLYAKGINYLSRQVDKHFGDNDDQSRLQLPKQVPSSSKFAIMPESYTGDTISVNDNQYIIPESINLKDIKLGTRNRGELTPLQTEGAIITNFNGYVPYESVNKNNSTATYMGVDKGGNFKVGTIDKFGNGDKLTRTYSNEVVSFAKDNVGNQEWREDSKHGNPGRYTPVINVLQNGKQVKGSLNILTSKNKKDNNTYGNITGGRVILQVGDEIRLVSGSIADIEKQFNDIKQRHGSETVTVYTLDNGSYNRGLRTRNKNLTSSDLRAYDNQNNGGGNFMYIKKDNTFSSDTIKTPNIRTKTDESYKKGHPIINEKKGVLLHHTAFMEPSLKNVTARLTDPKSQVSSHVVIGYDGHRRVLATPDDVTFHAGHSVWNNRSDVNDFMIGVEFQGDTNKKDLTPSQIQSVVEYLKPIIRKNNISLENITTHEQVRKLYNEYAEKQGLATKPSKPDINQRNYEKIINALLSQVYYKRGTLKYGGLVSTRPSLKSGGSIYIKPSHRGRLTELKARTGKSEAELYSDGNPAHKKMVVFARNARRWNK